MNAVEVISLSKGYQSGKQKIEAISDLSFSVDKAELFGIIGPDGAGKTTLMRIMTTLLLADSGTVHIDGLDVVKSYKEIRQRIGYMPGRFSLYQDLSVEENLEFFATIFKTSIHQNYDLIRDIYVQIEPFRKRLAGKLSGGMKQKLALCCALIHRPSVLFLDEPTTGVDAVSRKEFWQMLKNLQQEGIAILVSTPYMDEASLCDRIALIQEGRFLSVDSPEGTVKQYAYPLWAVKSTDMFRLQRDLLGFEAVHSVYPFGEYFHLSTPDNRTRQEDIEGFLHSEGHEFVEVEKIAPGIEDVFMELMKS